MSFARGEDGSNVGNHSARFVCSLFMKRMPTNDAINVPEKKPQPFYFGSGFFDFVLSFLTAHLMNFLVRVPGCFAKYCNDVEQIVAPVFNAVQL